MGPETLAQCGEDRPGNCTVITTCTLLWKQAAALNDAFSAAFIESDVERQTSCWLLTERAQEAGGRSPDTGQVAQTTGSSQASVTC